MEIRNLVNRSSKSKNTIPSFQSSLIIKTQDNTSQSLSSAKKSKNDNKIFKLPKIKIIVSKPKSSKKFDKETLLNKMLNIYLKTNPNTETNNCHKYRGSKIQENSSSSSIKKLIDYKSTHLNKTLALIPYKIKAISKLKYFQNQQEFFSFKNARTNNNYDENSKNGNRGSNSQDKKFPLINDYLNSLGSVDDSQQIINDLISQIKTSKNYNRDIIHQIEKPTKNNKEVNYDESPYSYMKSKSPKTQFSCSLSFPYLMTDMEYLNNLSKENNEKLKKNLK